MYEVVTLDGADYKMNEIKSMALEPISGTNPIQYQISVIFTNGRAQNYDLNPENVASLNSWIAYMLTIAYAYSPGKSLTNNGPK